jgi:predicted transcriptional regulator
MTKTIKLSDSTKDRLDNIKNGRTYDETISYLVDFMESINKQISLSRDIFEEPVIITK